jgi:hypothetical protein
MCRTWPVDTTAFSSLTRGAMPSLMPTGTKAGDFFITGPLWQGAVPRGMKQIPSPNNTGIAYRTGARGK